MTAAALLAKKANPTDADIDEAMRNNICRCGTYQSIRRAVHLAAQYQRRQRPEGRDGMSTGLTFNRRRFSAAGRLPRRAHGGFRLPVRGQAQGAPQAERLGASRSGRHVTLFIHKAEMGQGTVTSLVHAAG